MEGASEIADSEVEKTALKFAKEHGDNKLDMGILRVDSKALKPTLSYRVDVKKGILVTNTRGRDIQRPIRKKRQRR
jgi:hypothetical protein